MTCNAFAQRACASFANDLLQWYDENGRQLPWRQASPDPYNVWISEIMLQQTTVKTVIPYFKKWIERWPTLKDFSRSNMHEILDMWQGLGYYSRAYNLHKCAQTMIQKYGGHFPPSYKDLLTLPGIGPYTAAAISAIAFEQPNVTIDGNIARVFSRILQHAGHKTTLMSELPERLTSFLPQKRIGDYTQALMDLGALVCKPQNPECFRCPIQKHCQSFSAQTTHLFPHKKPHSLKSKRYGHFFCLLHQINVHEKYDILLEQGSERLLKGLWRPLTTPWAENETTPTFPVHNTFRLAGRIKHVFTHFALHLDVWYTILPQKINHTGLWDSLDTTTMPLSNLTRKALRQMDDALKKDKNTSSLAS